MGSLNRPLREPRWTGRESLAGKVLLVHAEQGIGDTVHFSRFVHALETRGATVIFEVQPALVPLMQSLGLRGYIVARGDLLPRFDLHYPLLSLPLALGTEFERIPCTVPYLHPEAPRAARWRERLAQIPGFKVGLVWQGNPDTERQPWIRGRSYPLAAASPLAEIEGVTLISLQKGAGSEQRAHANFGDRLVLLQDPADLSSESLLDAVSILAELDLLITSDTATAHLAGALGIPVWVVLKLVPDWRWFLNRTDSPWYPSMTLFRQNTSGDWAELMSRVAIALAQRVAQSKTWSARGS